MSNTDHLRAPGVDYPAPAQADRERAIAFARTAINGEMGVVEAASQPAELRNLAQQFLRALGLGA